MRKIALPSTSLQVYVFVEMKVLLVLLFVGTAYAVPTQSRLCPILLRESGFSSNFNETIAHAIHSMTVEGLQLFNPKATEKNNIPTVNMDRHSDQKVVRHAPEDKLGSDFTTMSMNTIDKILSNIGRDNDGLGPYWSPVERIAHKFHMWDVWMRVRQVFQDQTMRNPPSEEVCDCLLDVDNNGIYNAVAWVSNHYDSGTPITLLNRPIPKLTNAEAWQIWKERLLWYYQDRNLKDAASYLFCATKDF